MNVDKYPDLKECPFCGPSKCKPYVQKDNGLYQCRCGWCEASAPDSEDKLEAIKYWNTRAVPEDKSTYYDRTISETRKVNYGPNGVHLEAFDKVKGRWFTVGFWDGDMSGLITPKSHFE